METERDKLLLPPPSKEHGLFTSTDIIYRSASGVYDAADFLPDKAQNDWDSIPKIEVAPNTRYVEMHKQKVVPIETPHRKTFQTLYSDSVETLQSLGGWHNKGASAGALRRINNSFQMITD